MKKARPAPPAMEIIALLLTIIVLLMGWAALLLSPKDHGLGARPKHGPLVAANLQHHHVIAPGTCAVYRNDRSAGLC